MNVGERTVRFAAVIALAWNVAGCSSDKPTDPTGDPGGAAITTLVTGVTAADGTAGSQQAGALPAASGGPALAVTSNASVINGESAVVLLEAPAPFTTVYVSVSNTTGLTASSAVGGRAAATGFFRLQLKSPTSSARILVSLASSLPSNFTLSYAVASASGAVGATANKAQALSSPPAVTGGVGGTWRGAPDGFVSFDPAENCGRDTNALTLTLTQNGTTFTGTMAWTITESFFPPDVGKSNSVPITGTVKGNALTYTFGPDGEGNMYQTSATFTSTQMTGTVLQNPCPASTFTVNKQ